MCHAVLWDAEVCEADWLSALKEFIIQWWERTVGGWGARHEKCTHIPNYSCPNAARCCMENKIG